ncbi:MAG: type VI secretion system lipoprotein TssJ [Aquisalimonadaceae bacterium]
MMPRLLLMLFAMLLITGCGINRYLVPPYEKITLMAAEDANPDISGRPSPVTVKLLELSGRATFDNLDFDGAFFNAEVLLSDELLSSSDYVIQPGESITHRIDLHKEAGFVAVVAAFRDIDEARWKLIYPVTGNWYNSHTVSVSRNAVVFGASTNKGQ